MIDNIINWLRTHSPAFRHRYPAEVKSVIGQRLDSYTGTHHLGAS